LANGAPLALLKNDVPAEMGEPPHGLLPQCESSIASVGDGGHRHVVLHHTCR
jgi:hypothetical protein